MVVVGGPRAEQTRDFGIFSFCLVLRIFGEVFVDLRPEGCPNPPEGCPKPLGGPPYRALPIGALPIGPYRGPMGPSKGPPGKKKVFWGCWTFLGVFGGLKNDEICNI